MPHDPKAAVQAALKTLLGQVDDAIASAEKEVAGALKRRDVEAARRALASAHQYLEFRESVALLGWKWAKLQPMGGETVRAAASRAR